MKFDAVPEPPLAFLKTGINHILGGGAGLLAARRWLNERFAGAQAPDNCSAL